MPHKKGRARNTVPQEYNRTSRKANRSSKTSPPLHEFSPACRSHLACSICPSDEESLPLPSDVWLRIVMFISAVDLCRIDMLNKAAKQILTQEEASIWQVLCQLDFPSMWSSVKDSQCSSGSHNSNPSQEPSSPPSSSTTPTFGSVQFSFEAVEPPLRITDGVSENHTLESQSFDAAALALPDWKFLYARRYFKQRIWDATRGRSRSSSDIETSKPSAIGRVCPACGERFASANDSICFSHSGEFLPRLSASRQSPEGLELPLSREWSKAELNQLQQLVRAAWRNVGGSSGVCRNARNFKGGGHWAKYMGFKGWGSRGHWAEGCGPRPGSALIRDCIDGKIPCSWSCCGSEELISKGCTVGSHN